MVAILQSECSALECKNKVFMDYMIFVNNVGYVICKDCVKRFSKLHQLMLKDYKLNTKLDLKEEKQRGDWCNKCNLDRMTLVGYCVGCETYRAIVDEKRMKKKKDFWLYHPALNIPARNMTGRYRPAGTHKTTKCPLIEIELTLSDKNR